MRFAVAQTTSIRCDSVSSSALETAHEATRFHHAGKSVIRPAIRVSVVPKRLNNGAEHELR